MAVYGFDAYTARTIVREIAKLRSRIAIAERKSKKANGKPTKVLFAKTTLEPGSTCTAYRADYGEGTYTPNLGREVDVEDPLYSSFLLGLDDYDSSSENYVPCMFHAIYDPVVRKWSPIGENHLIVRARPDANVTAGNTGTFSVYVNETDSTYNLTGEVKWGDNGEDVSSSKDSWLRYNRFADKWEYIGGDCE